MLGQPVLPGHPSPGSASFCPAPCLPLSVRLVSYPTRSCANFSKSDCIPCLCWTALQPNFILCLLAWLLVSCSFRSCCFLPSPALVSWPSHSHHFCSLIAAWLLFPIYSSSPFPSLSLLFLHESWDFSSVLPYCKDQHQRDAVVQVQTSPMPPWTTVERMHRESPPLLLSREQITGHSEVVISLNCLNWGWHFCRL